MQHHGMGYLPDLPSIRDYTAETSIVNARLKSLGEKPVSRLLKATGTLGGEVSLPGNADLRKWCSPVEDQLPINSCTAQAAVSLIEYFERRAFGNHVDASRLFVYKVTRRLAGLVGDSGAYIRSTMEALTSIGAPPEEHWPYIISKVDEEPPAFCYAIAQNYRALSYFRLDPPGVTRQAIMASVKKNLSAKIPCMFGFTVYASYTQAGANGGKIPFPGSADRVVGGHAVVAVGYDDGIEITNIGAESRKTTGAFLIRNSWGVDWGDRGYGWLPYEYVLSGLADDFWCILKSSWIDSQQFRL